MQIKTVVLNEARNITLTSYLLEVGGEFGEVKNRPAVLIIPGGGYWICSDREADPVAMPYLQAGYHAFILRYSVKENAVWPNPLEDYEQAMELIRNNAALWHVIPDKIAVIGFSAGGHLAGCAATMSKNRPNAAILGYAVLSNDVKGCNRTAPDVIAAVDSNTCPCFLFSSRTDDCVHVSNTVKFMNALVEHDIAFESHIYAFGPHGYSTCDPSIQELGSGFCDRMHHWVEDSIGWLRDVLGVYGPAGVQPPRCPIHMTGNTKEYLSAECSIGYLMKNEQARSILEEYYKKLDSELPEQDQPFTEEEFEDFAYKLRLDEVMDYNQIPQSIRDEINQKLSEIPNVVL